MHAAPLLRSLAEKPCGARKAEARLRADQERLLGRCGGSGGFGKISREISGNDSSGSRGERGVKVFCLIDEDEAFGTGGFQAGDVCHGNGAVPDKTTAEAFRESGERLFHGVLIMSHDLMRDDRLMQQGCFDCGFASLERSSILAPHDTAVGRNSKAADKSRRPTPNAQRPKP